MPERLWFRAGPGDIPIALPPYYLEDAKGYYDAGYWKQAFEST